MNPIQMKKVFFSTLTEDYTLLRFNSIEEQPIKSESFKSSIQRKETFESVLSTKEYDEMKESIDSMKEEITQMKDKVNFLSAYTSEIDSNEKTKTKMESMRKEIFHTLENDLNKKLEKNLRNQMIETENVFIQQINNLTIKTTQELTEEIEKKTELFNFELEKLKENIFTKKEGEKFMEQVNEDLKSIASESMNYFVEKEEFRNYLNHVNKKIKIIENENKIFIEKAEKDKQQTQHFNSLLQVNSSNRKSSKSFSKISKSQSLTKSKYQNFNVSSETDEIDEKDKENLRKKSLHNETTDNFLKRSLSTSQVSKEFMKNFGLKQKKLIKSNFICSKKSSFHRNQNEFENKTEERPQTATPEAIEKIKEK